MNARSTVDELRLSAKADALELRLEKEIEQALADDE